MTIEYTGRQTDVAPSSDAGRAQAREAGRVLRGITDVHVILAADKHRQTAEVSVHSPHLDLAATEESATWPSRWPR